ncbi:hypothetical protein BKA70DRAFT_453836 [Coprinopsis sp. MPI-PUGE-AT-0042]|nr:hypothetical protein BKA70DRAFT_453836 [Coprinopsis sp. MPI-PUGE-AT-0042]
MPPAFPLEIILKCMNELSGDPATLKNCALVCSGLQIASQELLFATINIEVEAADSCLRIQRLTSSPRLVSYIRHLILYLNRLDFDRWKLWLHSEAHLLLNLLQTITPAKIRSFSFRDHCMAANLTSLRSTDLPVAKDLLHAIAQICASPSLHTLEVACLGGIFLLEVCSPSVQNLFIADQLLNVVSNEIVTPGHTIRIPPIGVKNLELVLPPWDSGIIDHYLVGPQRRVCFGTLSHLHVFSPSNQYEARIQGILDQCEDTLVSLVLGYVEIVTEPPTPPRLSNLRNLRSLHLTYPVCPEVSEDRSRWLKDELAAFVSERPSKLQELAFTYVVFPSAGPADDVPPSMIHWGAISSLLSQDALFPDLKRVEVSTRCYSWGERVFNEGAGNLGCEYGFDVLSPCFRELFAKGILEIRHMEPAKASRMGEESFYHFVQPRIEPYQSL